MRRATGGYCLWIIDNKFVGISLGHDYCAEHEWGITEMKSLFGIPEDSSKNMGIKSRVITTCPRSLIFKEEIFKKQKCAILFTQAHSWLKDVEIETLPDALEDYKRDIEFNIKYYSEHPSRQPKDPMICAWNSSSFGVGVMGEKEVVYLKELYDAFLNENIAIATINLAPNNPFSNNSLSLLIVDRLPQEALDNMYNADKEYYSRVDYEKKIGMTKIKEKYSNKNGCDKLHYYMACSAKWIDYKDAINREKCKKELKTKYDIHYWINYSDDDNNSGWYTVEEIKEWLTGNKKLTEIRKAK